MNKVINHIINSLNLNRADNIYYKTRVDNDFRWELIKQNIDDSDSSLIDIGCAEGYLTHKAAKKGLFSIGIDNDSEKIEYACEQWTHQTSCLAFMQCDIGPEKIHEIPPADIILYLTVHHHWVREFGEDQTNKMVKTLAHKCNKLVFEPPGDRKLPSQKRKKMDKCEIVNHYTTYINEVFNGSARIKEVKMTPWKGKNKRFDPVFIIETDGYHLEK